MESEFSAIGIALSNRALSNRALSIKSSVYTNSTHSGLVKPGVRAMILQPH